MLLAPDQIDFDQLPVSLRDMAETIGLTASLALVEHYGGITLEIPKRINDKHYLAKTLGKEIALCFCQVYGGELMYIPLAANTVRNLRNRQIIQDYTDGIPINRLVKKYRLCNRQLWRVLKEPVPIPGETRQMSLFDDWK